MPRSPAAVPRLLRLVPGVMMTLIALPVVMGLAGVVVVACGAVPVFSSGLSLDEALVRLLMAPGMGRSILLSLASGLVTTALALAISFLALAATHGKQRLNWVRRALSPLLSVPHAAVAVGLGFLIAPSGFLARLLSPWATGWNVPPDLLITQDRLGLSMMAGLIAKEVPFLLLVLLSALSGLQGERAMNVMTSLGHARMSGFLLALGPRLYRQVRLPVLAVLAYASAQVDVALVLGPTTPPVLAVRLLELARDADPGLRQLAAAAALIQVGVTLLVLGGWLAVEKGAGLAYRAVVADGWRPGSERALAGVSLVLGLMPALMVAGGALALLLWSLAGPYRFPEAFPERLSLAAFARFQPLLEKSLGSSFLIAALSALAALVLVILALAHESATRCRPSAKAMAVLFLPLLVPQVAFLFGLQIAAIFLHLDGTRAGVALVHLVFVLPYVYLSLSGPWHRLDPRFEAVAASLGLGWWRRLVRIRLFLLIAPVLTALAIGLAVSLGQYLPTVLIGAGRVETLTTQTLALASGGDRRLLGVAALYQALLPFVGFAFALFIPSWLFANRKGMAR